MSETKPLKGINLPSITSYTAEDLFSFLSIKEDMLVLDVRNEEDFSQFNVEGPFPFQMKNVPYINFMEEEDESVAKISNEKPVKIVCAKEGSAQYVGEILMRHGFEDVSYLINGIKSWGNLLLPKRINNESDDYALYQFIRPGKASCNYGLLYKREMVIFDPSRNIEFYQSFANENDAKIVRIFETHLQADYISGSKQISNVTGAEILAHAGDFSEASFRFNQVNEGDTYTIGSNGPEIRVIHTPGHTPGSTSYIIDDKYFLYGDTVFIHSIGRPDLGGKAEKWSVMLYDTLTNKVQNMNENWSVLPGHFMNWNEANKDLAFTEKLGKVKENNATVYGIESPEKFTQYVMDNMQKSPDVYFEIRKVNYGWLDVDIDEADVMDLGKNECAAMSYTEIQKR